MAVRHRHSKVCKRLNTAPLMTVWGDGTKCRSHFLQPLRNDDRAYSKCSVPIISLLNRQNEESVRAFKHALDLNYRPSTVMYNIACGYARANQNDAAMEWLQKARAAGFKLGNYIEHDNDLNSLRSDPRFRELRKQVRRDRHKDQSDNWD